MVCVLFHGYIVLCRHSDGSRKLQLVASIYVLDMGIDVLTNGIGKAALVLLSFHGAYICQDFTVILVAFLGRWSSNTRAPASNSS